jgi:hypothetical protein
MSQFKGSEGGTNKMEVWLCEYFDGDGYSAFAICKDLEACRKESLRYYKKGRFVNKNIKLKDVKIEDTDNPYFKKISMGFETYNLTLMNVIE